MGQKGSKNEELGSLESLSVRQYNPNQHARGRKSLGRLGNQIRSFNKDNGLRKVPDELKDLRDTANLTSYIRINRPKEEDIFGQISRASLRTKTVVVSFGQTPKRPLCQKASQYHLANL